MLEYDDSAFYYFTLTMMTIYLVPMSIHVLFQVIRAVFPKREERLAGRTQAEVDKVKALQKSSEGLGVLLKSWTFGIKMTTLVVGWAFFYWLLTNMHDDAEIASFDPYAILGVDIGAEARAIKSAYRQLSLKYHPDKNPGNKMAEDMFMKIAKAYEALTDPAAKENWEKYGNPDGKQPMEVSIALPTFLLDKDWHNTVLIVYLLAMCIVVPALVAMWYAHSKKYGDKNVMYTSYTWFNHMLSEATQPKKFPEILAGASEFHKLNALKPGEMGLIDGMFKDIQACSDAYARRVVVDMAVQKVKAEQEGQRQLAAALAKRMTEPVILFEMSPRYNIPIIRKGMALITAHCSGGEVKVPPSLKPNLNAMLVKIPDLTEALIELAQSRRWLKTTIDVIVFSQWVTQGLWMRDKDMQQLPHVTMEVVSALQKGTLEGKGIKDFIRMSDEEKSKALEPTSLKEAQKKDVIRVANTIPNVDMEVSVFVEDEEVIAENDYITIKVTVTRNNLKEGELAQPVYAPRTPMVKEEGWWVVIGNTKKNHLVACDKITGQKRVEVLEMKILAPNQACSLQLDVFLLSDSYMGLNKRETAKFDVVSASTLPAYTPHPDDLELDNEPTLFEQVMQPQDDDSDDSDEDDDDDDDDDDDEGKKKSKKAAKELTDGKGKEGAAMNGKTKEDDDDDDDDDEDDDDDDDIPALEVSAT